MGFYVQGRGSAALSQCIGFDISKNPAASLTPAAPELDGRVYQVTGDTGTAKGLTQTVAVSGSAGDTYVLSGWAKGDAAPFKAEKVGNTVKTIGKAITTNTVRSMTSRAGNFALKKALIATAENLATSTVQSVFGKIYTLVGNKMLEAFDE